MGALMPSEHVAQHASNWFVKESGLLVHVSIILLSAAFLALFIRFIGRRLVAGSSSHRRPLREALYRSTHAPLFALICLTAAYLVGVLVNSKIHLTILAQVLDPGLRVGVLVVVAWTGWNLIEVYPFIHRRRGEDLDPMLLDIVGKLVRFVLVIIIGMMVLRTLHFSIASLLTFGGVAGIAVGFAAQGVVSNLFGALVVYLDRPFKVGEWIVLPQLNIFGTVEHIGWRSTRLRGFDTRPYYVPNQVFNTHVVQTPPRMQARRIDHTLPVRYADVERLPKILQELRDYIHKHPQIDHSLSEMVYFTNYGVHSLDILIYCFARTVQWADSLETQENVLLEASRIIKRNGARLALPITRVQLQNSDSAEDVADIDSGLGPH